MSSNERKFRTSFGNLYKDHKDGFVAEGKPFELESIEALDGMIENAYETVKKNKFDDKIIALNKIIKTKFGFEDDISAEIAKVALGVTKMKKNAILSQENIPSKWFKEKIDNLKLKILPSVNLNNETTNEAQLALCDFTLLMAYLMKNYREVIHCDDSISKQCENIAYYGGLKTLIMNLEEPKH